MELSLSRLILGFSAILGLLALLQQVLHLNWMGSFQPLKTTTPPNDLTYFTFGSIALEELGLQYKLETIDIRKNIQKEPWYIDINPNGKIPALKDGNQRIFESGAILLYLTDKYDQENRLSYQYGTPDYYEMLSWLMFQMSGVGPMQGQANHFRAMATVRSDYAIERYLKEVKRLYSVLEIRLSKADWLAGDKYTIADIANYSWVRSGPDFLEIDMSPWPGVEKWIKNIDRREAVQRGLKVPPTTTPIEERKTQLKRMRDKVDAMTNTDKYSNPS